MLLQVVRSVGSQRLRLVGLQGAQSAHLHASAKLLHEPAAEEHREPIDGVPIRSSTGL